MNGNKPSWEQWPPNCCETCTGWSRDNDTEYEGICNLSPIYSGDRTDSRFRCKSFKRKTGK
jgi:hypothetical protein